MALGDLAARIERFDVDDADLPALTSALSDVRRLQGEASVREARIARRLSELERAGQAPPASEVLARAGNVSGRSAERAGRRAEALGDAAALERQLAQGRVSNEHADALANAIDKLDEPQRAALLADDVELAERAAASTPGQFARFLRRRADLLAGDDEAANRSEQQRSMATLSHGIDDATGMGWIRASLHPDDYQRVARKLDAEVAALRTRADGDGDGRRYDQLAAAALVGLVTGGRAASVPVAEVTVLIDLDTLQQGTHSDSICEYGDGQPLPVATVRRHACNADIIPVVLGGDGQPLDVGRAKRQATRAQRTALRSMYRTCGIDGCETGFDRCEMHHVAEWDAHGGLTDLGNLVPICSFHHHRVHEGRWRLQLDPSTRQLDVFLPNGALHRTGQPDLLAERLASHITGQTNRRRGAA